MSSKRRPGTRIGSVPSNHSLDTKEPAIMPTLKIIIGSTRPGLARSRVSPWVIDQPWPVSAYDVEVRDWREWPVPISVGHLG
jgi:hypothetical protein